MSQAPADRASASDAAPDYRHPSPTGRDGSDPPGSRTLHPRHGVHAPRPAIPARRPGSVRRTVTIDTSRPDGFGGPTVQRACVRDLRTASDGAAEVLSLTELTATIDYPDNFRLVAIESDPADPRLADLVGTSVSTGFRATAAERFPVEVEHAMPLYTLLDDLPGAALVSGHAIVVAGTRPSRRSSVPILQVEGLCAGFRAGGTILNGMANDGLPPLTTGPVAPGELTDDAVGMHDLRPLSPHDMRRLRVLDVRPAAAGEPVEVEAYFRDTHVDGDGVETVIHEYTVSAWVDPVSETVTRSSADAHALPWVECIEAEASGERVAGRPLRGLRPAVREDLVGVTTCTHLNDTLRSIEDVRALLPLLAPVAG